MLTEPTICTWCGDVLLDQDRNGVMRDHHHECAVRSIVGPLAHLEKRCSCYVPGSTEHDPPELDKRSAAIKVYLLWRSQQRNSHEYRDALKV